MSSTPGRSTPGPSVTSRRPPSAGDCPPATTPCSATTTCWPPWNRKSVADLVGSLLSGRLTYALADLAALPRAAVVVEDRYSRLFNLEHASGAAAAEALAESQARFPTVPVVFCETRPLAQEWAYRWLGACLTELDAAVQTAGIEASFAAAAPVPAPAPAPAAVREWARANGLPVSGRGRIPGDVVRRYLDDVGR